MNYIEIARKYEEEEAKILQITGYRLKDLIVMFSAGWTLRPPEPPQSLKGTLEKKGAM